MKASLLIIYYIKSHLSEYCICLVNQPQCLIYYTLLIVTSFEEVFGKTCRNDRMNGDHLLQKNGDIELDVTKLNKEYNRKFDRIVYCLRKICRAFERALSV